METKMNLDTTKLINPDGPMYEQRLVKTMQLWQGLLVIVMLIGIVSFGGVEVGKKFFWNQFDRTPLVEREYQQALKLVQTNPNDANNYVDLGWRMFQMGKYNDALAQYKKATELDANNYKAYLNLGLAYKQEGKNDLAITAFLKAVDLAPKSTDPHYYLGAVYNTEGKYADALKELTLAVQQSPGSVDIIYALGQTYEKMGNIAEAKNQYATALQFDPKNTVANDALKRLGGQ